MLKLAVPVIAADIGWIAMGMVDTLLVRPLGPAAIGAVGTGSILFMAVMMVGLGTLFALDTFVAHSYGARRVDECHRWLFAGLQLAAILCVILTGLSLGLVAALPAFDFHPEVLGFIQPYLTHLLWSIPPLLVYGVCRRYLQAMNVVWPIMTALIVANIVNAVANWLLIEGHYGFPALGVVGSAYATVLSRVALAAALFVVIVRRERGNPSGLHDVPFVWDPARVSKIVRLGIPAAGQILLEVGVFAAASALAARITPAAVAAHQIVLNIAGFIFMVPYGLGSAAAVRVGNAIGRGDAEGAKTSGWMALLMGTLTMSVSAMMFWLIPRWLMWPFTDDAEVITIGIGLFLVASIFQLFDGLQTVTTGALRGLGETRIPMLVNLVGHWLIGLPLAYLLCFRYGWAAQGLWMGLAAGLILIGATLLGVWHQQSGAVVALSAAPRQSP